MAKRCNRNRAVDRRGEWASPATLESLNMSTPLTTRGKQNKGGAISKIKNDCVNVCEDRFNKLESELMKVIKLFESFDANTQALIAKVAPASGGDLNEGVVEGRPSDSEDRDKRSVNEFKSLLESYDRKLKRRKI